MEAITIPLPATRQEKLCDAVRLLPDTPVDRAGIYQCENCRFEAVVRKYECLPREKSCSEHGSADPSEDVSEVTWRLATAVLEKPEYVSGR